MINVILPVVSLLMMTTTLPDIHRDNDDALNKDSIVVNELEVSTNSLILDILKDVLSECDQSETGNIYSLYLKKYESGIKVFVTQEHNERIDRSKFNDAIGYITLGKDTIIVSGKHIPDFTYSRNPQSIRFPMGDYMRNDSQEWLYFINNGIFARDGESMGWIWHIPADSLSDYELTKFAITAPIRTKK